MTIKVNTIKRQLREKLRQKFDALTLGFERDYRGGLRILAKLGLKHRLLMGGMIAANLGAAVFEGGTIAILSVAVSVLVDNDAAGIWDKAGMIGTQISYFKSLFGRGGLFLALVVGAVFAQVLRSGLTFLGKYLAVQLRFRVTQKLQDLVTRQAMTFSYAEVGRYPAGVVNMTIGQAAKFAQLVEVLNIGLLSVIMFAVYVALMITMSIPLTLSALVVVAVIGLGLTGVIRKLKTLGNEMLTASLRMGRLSFEYLQAPRLLRVFDATKQAEDSISEARKQMLAAEAKAQGIKVAVGPATDALTIGGAGLFLIVGYLVAGEGATAVVPKLLLFVFILNRMMPKVKEFNQARMEFANKLPATKHVAGFLRTEDKSYTRRGGVPFANLTSKISFDNVSFRYPETEAYALSNINFTISQGETVALVGASGAGKSTLADLFLGLHDPTEGSILVDGVDLRQLDLRGWRSRIGVVDQEVFLLNASLYDNITFAGKEHSKEDVVRAAEAAYAHSFIEDLPEGYETSVGDRGYRLSGGQQQRIAIARALLRNPDILVLDEATSALDTESERIIQKTLEDLHHQRTMLVIAHRLSTLTKADKIIVLERGRIVEQGSWETLMAKSGVFADLWRMQTGYSAVG